MASVSVHLRNLPATTAVPTRAPDNVESAELSPPFSNWPTRPRSRGQIDDVPHQSRPFQAVEFLIHAAVTETKLIAPAG